MKTTDDVFFYVSEFFRVTDTKLDALKKQIDKLRDTVTQVQNHVSGIYALEHKSEDLKPATGHMRLKQLGCLKLLRMIDKVLKEHGIEYFLGYGTLLGAARHGDFIPWDDDADICLMREHFERALEILPQYFNTPPFHTEYAQSGRFMKVYFGNHVWVDLFPQDYYFKRMDEEEVPNFIARYVDAMKKARAKETKKKVPYLGGEEYEELRKDVILQGNEPDMESGDIFEGIDWQIYVERAAKFFHSKPFHREYVLPLGEIEFCGEKFPAPHDVDAWLTTRFGDWHEFKPDFARHKGSMRYPDVLQLQEFLNDD